MGSRSERPRMIGAGRVARGWVFVALVGLTGCEEERPPAPPARSAGPEAGAPSEGPSEGPTAAESASFDPKTDKAVLTYAGERGALADTSDPSKVPEEARGLVRVALLGGQPPPPEQVWVANLRQPDAEGRFALSPVPRDHFEELALGQGRSSKFELPPGLEPPERVAAATGQVVVYKTSWCGVCKQVEAYLTRKGVDYVAKDIEQDREAAAELQAKASQKGVKTGSVPIIDVGGELLVGFDRDRLEKLLAG